MGKIRIQKSPTADTRTCDWADVSKKDLLYSSHLHLQDVNKGMQLFSNLLSAAALKHDHDKISGIDEFHKDFKTGFDRKEWFDRHLQVNRHHLNNPGGIPGDVNLVDVIEHLVDCVAAGMARSGDVYELSLPPGILERAFQNSVKLLKANIEVVG